MGALKSPAPVKLICSILAGAPGLLDEARAALIERWGPADFVSEVLPFEHTDYYAGEMGAGLLRQIVAFAGLIDPAALPDIKIATNELERRWLEAGRRRVNLDPGYLTLAKLVLATTKDHGHRIYLRDGIYAEVTLRFRDGHFQPWEWTYPDYGSPAYCEMFGRLRAAYKENLPQVRKPAGG
jgi:hypothetical protein